MDGWNKFFIGVRWLGPDLSFFDELKKTQAERVASEMEVWGGGLKQSLAECIGRVLAEQLGWKSTFFLPGDAADVVFHGPRFDFNDPESALEAIIEVLARDFSISVLAAFWAEHSCSTFAELVDDLLKRREGQNANGVVADSWAKHLRRQPESDEGTLSKSNDEL